MEKTLGKTRHGENLEINKARRKPWEKQARKQTLTTPRLHGRARFHPSNMDSRHKVQNVVFSKQILKGRVGFHPSNRYSRHKVQNMVF
jgi:uncharacterized membrane protein YsdA (DUF1294 family)